MSDDPRIGWGGEVHLSTDDDPTNYVELVGVTSFDLPDEQADEKEVTTLKSPNKRKEFISGLTDGGTVNFDLNYAPGSPSDVAIRNAKDAGDTRAIKFIIPDANGDPEHKVETFCFVKGYKRGPVQPGEVIKAVVTVRITGAETEGAA